MYTTLSALNFMKDEYSVLSLYHISHCIKGKLIQCGNIHTWVGDLESLKTVGNYHVVTFNITSTGVCLFLNKQRYTNISNSLNPLSPSTSDCLLWVRKSKYIHYMGLMLNSIAIICLTGKHTCVWERENLVWVCMIWIGLKTKIKRCELTTTAV